MLVLWIGRLCPSKMIDIQYDSAKPTHVWPAGSLLPALMNLRVLRSTHGSPNVTLGSRVEPTSIFSVAGWVRGSRNRGFGCGCRPNRQTQTTVVSTCIEFYCNWNRFETAGCPSNPAILLYNDTSFHLCIQLGKQ